LVERDLAKVEVAGSSPVFRSESPASSGLFFEFTLVAEQVDAQDLKSCLQKCGYGFDSRLGYTWEFLPNFFLTAPPGAVLFSGNHVGCERTGFQFEEG
jgi:hypothetical protein